MATEAKATDGSRRPEHVFIGFIEVAGYYRNLQVGLEELGHRSTFLDLSGNPYRYERRTPNPRWAGFAETLLELIRGKPPIPRVRNLAWKLSIALLLLPIATWALLRCDVFVFGFRTGFARHLLLPMMHLMGKRTVYIFHGSDVRPPYLSGSSVPTDGPINGADLARRTKRIKADLRRIERWASAIISHPAISHLQSRRFVP